MKKQETVEKNYHKVVQQWNLSRMRKVQNIDKQLSMIEEKITRLIETKKCLLSQKESLLNSPVPQPPTQEYRAERSALSLKMVARDQENQDNDTLQESNIF